MYVTPFHLRKFIDFLQFDEEIIVYDCETTGLSPYKKGESPEAHIIQLSAKKLQHEYGLGFTIISEREWYIKPIEPIPDKIIELTGITDEFLEDKPSEAEVFHEIMEFFGNTAVVGYNNLTFDDMFMQEMYKRYGQEFQPFISLDMYKISQVMVSPREVPNYKLKTIAGHFGYDDAMFHNASGDVNATMVLMELYEKNLIEQERKTGNAMPAYDAGIKVKVTKVSRFEKGNLKRIYVNTADPEVTFFMDVKNLGWDCKDKSLSPDRFNMPDMIAQALNIAHVRDEKELAKFK